MGFTCGIIGLPNVGKSTLFNAITAAGAQASNYPFCTIEPNIGVVPVPDPRLGGIARICRPGSVVPTTIEFVDIAGLVKGASRGEGLGNTFLMHIRNVDALAHIVRCFDDPNVVHVDGKVNPRRDIEVVETELVLRDLETVEAKLSDAQKRSKSGDKKTQSEREVLTRIRDHLRSGRLARYFLVEGEEEEESTLGELHLLTVKPVMYVCNVHEDDAAGQSEYVRSVREVAAEEGAEVVVVSAEVEAEVGELPVGERGEFLRGLGIEESGLDKFIRQGYSLLHLVTFFTVNEKELHAWTVPQGTVAPEAGGKVHTDFERGFIRVEVMTYDDLMRMGSEQGVKEAGLLSVHGRDYVVRDGDIVFFRFHV
jgi:GTP-binding protein YchF